MKRVLYVGVGGFFLLAIIYFSADFAFNKPTSKVVEITKEPLTVDTLVTSTTSMLIGTWQLFDTSDPENARLADYYMTYNKDGTYVNKGGSNEIGTWALVAKKDTVGVASFIQPEEVLLEEKSGDEEARYWSIEFVGESLTLWQANENGRGLHVSFVKVKN